MVSHSPSLIFVTPDPTFLEPQIQIWVLEGPGSLWGPRRGPEKDMFVKGLVRHEVTKDFVRE